MAEKNSDTSPPKPDSNREERLKSALKANLARRKAQARARSVKQADADGNTEG